MTNPDSAMAAAREIKRTYRPISDDETVLAAIIRKYQAQEIGELVKLVRDAQNCVYFYRKNEGNYLGGVDLQEWEQKAESLLSRYPKV